ncbi:hypothetical protein KR222_003221 [Zaprionus bogoriensis]|nr:hypothetical protein KR222_003221 [Zaprionus bogoriensis]
MSVAAMTMDDQRPLMNSYDKMTTKYDPNLHLMSSGGGAGDGGVVDGVGSNGGAGAGATNGPCGPASPTPSGSEELPSSHQQPHHHHHHHTTSSLVQQTQEQDKHRHHHHLQTQQQQQHPQQHEAVVAEAVAAAEQRRLLEDEIENLKLEQNRLGLQCADAQRREKILMRRLANKEQEFQDYVSQIAEYKAQQAPTALALRTALLDPAVNLLFERLKKELKATKAKLEETQNELSAWKFTPDSNTGKRLMAKCRLLYQENEELGKMTSNGRLAKLETELAMQKSFSEEVKKSQSELDDFLQELDEDVEGMQSTILFLQQELKTTRDRIHSLEKENAQLRQITNEKNQKENIENTATTVATITNGENTNATSDKQFQQSSCNRKLETIEENTSQEMTKTTVDYYNGKGNEQQPLSSDVMSDECSNSNSSKSGAVARLARKRNYEDECSNVVCGQETAAIPAKREISTPRTLPPKKSKLRGIAAQRRSSHLDEQIVIATPQVVDGGSGMATEVSTPAPAIITNVSDQVLSQSADAEVGSTAPERILTRRRSVRMQQNGNSGNDY